MLFGGLGNDTLDWRRRRRHADRRPGNRWGGLFGIAQCSEREPLHRPRLRDAQGDVLGGIENVIGSAFGDALTGDNGNNTLIGGAGADTLTGGLGVDTADYSASAGAVNVNLLNGTGSGGDAQGDVLSGIENVVGSNQADMLTGNNGSNALAGGLGTDRLDGGRSHDTLTGGPGADTFLFLADALTPVQLGSAFRPNPRLRPRQQRDVQRRGRRRARFLGADFTRPCGRFACLPRSNSGKPERHDGNLQIDSDGMANGANWTTIARLDGVDTGNSVTVVLDASQSAGTMFVAPALVPTKNFDGDGHGDILWQSSAARPRHG